MYCSLYDALLESLIANTLRHPAFTTESHQQLSNSDCRADLGELLGCRRADESTRFVSWPVYSRTKAIDPIRFFFAASSRSRDARRASSSLTAP